MGSFVCELNRVGAQFQPDFDSTRPTRGGIRLKQIIARHSNVRLTPFNTVIQRMKYVGIHLRFLKNRGPLPVIGKLAFELFNHFKPGWKTFDVVSLRRPFFILCQFKGECKRFFDKES